jgi:energy-converting hydrogenase Eha subunit A
MLAASVGTLLWLYLVFSRPPGMLQGTAELAVLAAPLIAIPLSLEASSAWTKRSASVCAAGVVGAYYLAPGFASGMFALPWVLFAALTFIQLTLRENVLSRTFRALSDPREIPLLLELCAHAYLIVGALWLCASRFGMTPLGFREPWVVLTANHFHYAGYVVSIMGARASALALRTKTDVPTWFAWTLRSVGLGPPIVAIGITGVPLLEVVSAIVLALSLAAYAWVMSTRLLRTVDETSARILLRISSACLFFTMSAACIYTVGHYFHRELISITTMIRIHGMINAGGFAILGLIGFAIESRTRKTA